LLAKVRALLAKAESTTFETEAEALTAKVQELMARHRIDRALLDAGGHQPDEQPIGRRIGTENPYADAKAALLGKVARADGCKAVWSPQRRRRRRGPSRVPRHDRLRTVGVRRRGLACRKGLR
jgi:hypothetical protein